MATKKPAKKTAKKLTTRVSSSGVLVARSPKTGAFIYSTPKAKKAVGKEAPKLKFAKFATVERSPVSGKLIFNGEKASQLINKYPGVKIQRATVKPKHLSEQKIAEMLKSMKVA